jgi:DNA repair protein RecO (recombination protein O)
MSTTYLALGVVLKRREYREVDRIITIFTDEYGKIDAIARGVRKPLSKLAGHLEPFSYSSFMFATGRTFDVLATSVRRSSFQIPQTDLVSFALASYFFEAADRLTRPRQPDVAVFQILVEFLERFEASLDPHGGTPVFQRILLTEYFLFRLIQHLGFSPSLDRCSYGKEFLPPQPCVLSASHGGLVCSVHRQHTEHAVPISAQSVEILRLMADGHLEAIRFIRRTRATLSEIARAMNTLITYHIGEPLASRSFVRSVLSTYEETESITIS